jgi:hypothetical protein
MAHYTKLFKPFIDTWQNQGLKHNNHNIYYSLKFN